MTNQQSLLALAERCEQASGPDRELDRDVALAVGQPWADVRALAYTASLDAAMTLVPHGWGWAAHHAGHARVERESAPHIVDAQCDGEAATPALALTAAALRAHSTIRGEDGR